MVAEVEGKGKNDHDEDADVVRKTGGGFDYVPATTETERKLVRLNENVELVNCQGKPAGEDRKANEPSKGICCDQRSARRPNLVPRL